MNDHEFSPSWKRGVYEAIFRRRDKRSFKPDPIPDEVLARILYAANEAGSVGFMQPWDFILIQDQQTREQIRSHVDDERLRAADGFEGERQDTYLKLKLEGIVESPINICVTCDRKRFGPAVLGRNTILEADIFSTVAAVQNMWLAGRAEGVGIGWVSLLRNEFLSELFGLPEQVLPVAYLCVGYPKAFGSRPTLEVKKWLPRIPFAEQVYEDGWGCQPGASLGQYLGESSTGLAISPVEIDRFPDKSSVFT